MPSLSPSPSLLPTHTTNRYQSFSWSSVAIITSDDQYARDLGEALARKMRTVVSLTGAKVGKVIFNSTFKELAADVTSDDDLTAAALGNIKPLVDQARNLGARIFFVQVARVTTYAAVLKALKASGILERGYAVTSAYSSFLGKLAESNEPLLDGLIAVRKAPATECLAAWCPPATDTTDGGNTVIPSWLSSRMAEAHDAVYALAVGLAKSFYHGDGGAKYLSGDKQTRLTAMADLRDVILTRKQAATGSLSFAAAVEKKNNRATWNFQYELINFQEKVAIHGGGLSSTITEEVSIGFVKESGFAPAVPETPTRWPGKGSERPLDFDRKGDPANLTVGWVVDTSWGDAAFQAMRAMYAQQAIDQVNADKLYVLPKTKLFLEFVHVDTSAKNASRAGYQALFGDLVARAAAAGRPMAGMLGSTSTLATAFLDATDVKQVPMVGYYTAATHLSNKTKYPNFVRIFPPVTISSKVSPISFPSPWAHVCNMCPQPPCHTLYHHPPSSHDFVSRFFPPGMVVAKFAVKYGWSRMAMIGDVKDLWSVSWTNHLNATTQSNAVNIEYAELLDWNAVDLSTTLDKVVDTLKAKDLHIIIFALYTSHLTTFIEHALGRGILGDGYQIIVGDTISESEIQQVPAIVRAAMDGSIMIYPGGASSTFRGYRTAESFWNQQPQSGDAAFQETRAMYAQGGGTFLGGDGIEIPYLLDAIGILAVGLEGCINGQVYPKATDDSHDVVMPYIRNAAFDGVTGLASFDTNTNDPKGRLFDVWSGNNGSVASSSGSGSSSSSAAAGPQFKFTKVATTSALFPSLEVCTPPEIGDKCALTAAPPGKVSCFASSATSIQVTWEPAAAQGGRLLSGYRVTMSAGKEIAVSNVGTTGHRVTFTTTTAGVLGNKLDSSKRVVFGALYTVSVESLWDNGMVVSKTTNCLTPQNGLPCIPPPITIPAVGASSAGKTTGTLDLTQRLPKDSEDLAVCGCKSSEYHTQSIPGYPPRFWECRPCVAGTKCVGGTAATVQTLPGWFVSGNHSVGLTTLGKNGSQYAIGLPKLWPCPGGASACPGGKLVVPFLSHAAHHTRQAGVGPCSNSSSTSYECQCGRGHVGMLCRTCLDDWVMMGRKSAHDNIVRYTCKKCSMPRLLLLGLVIAAWAGALLVILAALAVHNKVTRAAPIHVAFFNAFADIQTVGATRAVNDFFGEGSHQGITRQLFASVCKKKLSSGAALREDKEDRALAKLFDKLDADRDGVISISELLKTLYGLKTEKQVGRMKRCSLRLKKFAKNIKEGVFLSHKSRTLRYIIITHFQLSAITKNFPSLKVARETGGKSETGAADAALPSSNGFAVVTAEIQSVGNEIAGAVGDINLRFADFISCLTGNREKKRGEK